jgi:hypothetical protein
MRRQSARDAGAAGGGSGLGATRSSWGEAPAPPSGLPSGLAAALARCDSALGGSANGPGAAVVGSGRAGAAAAWQAAAQAADEEAWAEVEGGEEEEAGHGLATPELDGQWDEARQLGAGFPHVAAAPLSESTDWAAGRPRARERSDGGGVSHATYTVTATTPPPADMRPRLVPLALAAGSEA